MDETCLPLSWRLGCAQTKSEGAPLTPPSLTEAALTEEIPESPALHRLLADVEAMCLSREAPGRGRRGHAGSQSRAEGCPNLEHAPQQHTQLSEGVNALGAS